MYIRSESFMKGKFQFLLCLRRVMFVFQFVDVYDNDFAQIYKFRRESSDLIRNKDIN